MYIDIIRGASNFDKKRAKMNAIIQNGKHILYSNTPKNLGE